jgi:Na+/glutamate symporter
LAGVVLAGVAIIGNGTLSVAGVVLMLLTGFALYGIELWHHPDLWREVAGVFIAVKLIMLVAMLLVPNIAGPLFWLLLISSSVVSHAPRVFRHRRIFG